MDNLPEVLAFGMDPEQKRWWCVMRNYDYTLHTHSMDKGLDAQVGRDSVRGSQKVAEAGCRASDWGFSDMHAGNIMWSEARKQWIITDPCCGPFTLSAEAWEYCRAVRRAQQASERQAMRAFRGKPRKVAAWKIPQLQQQMHMRML
jgi:hypothetical protein